MTTLPPAEDRALAASAAAFTRDMVVPNAAAWERERRFPTEAYKAAAEHGLTTMLVPSELGGGGHSRSAAAAALEEIGSGCFALALSLEVQNNFADSLARRGTPALVERFLPGIIAGQRIAAFLLTEPGAGSDVAGITTTATRDGDGWIIDGEKAWITNAAVADTLLVYAQTDATLGWRGIAAFLVDSATPGIERLPTYGLMGGHAMGTGGFVFSNCRVGGDALLVGDPGEAFKEALAVIDVARVGVAALCCGMMRAGLDCALAYAAERRAFGQSTLEFQGLQWMLADVATDLEAARLLTAEAAEAVNRNEGTIAAAHAKKFATRVALKGLADCMQVMGAAGYSEEYPLGRHLACAKMAQYLDGTTEIQNLVIARDLVRRATAK
jgi:alkylation response protein AidB-like acyl-CoA dehydrogenase